MIGMIYRGKGYLVVANDFWGAREILGISKMDTVTITPWARGENVEWMKRFNVDPEQVKVVDYFEACL